MTQKKSSINNNYLNGQGARSSTSSTTNDRRNQQLMIILESTVQHQDHSTQVKSHIDQGQEGDKAIHLRVGADSITTCYNIGSTFHYSTIKLVSFILKELFDSILQSEPTITGGWLHSRSAGSCTQFIRPQTQHDWIKAP